MSLRLGRDPEPPVQAIGGLLRRFRERRRLRLEKRLQQPLPLGQRGARLRLLDVAEAADLSRIGGERDAASRLAGGQILRDRVEHFLVVGEKLPLPAPLGACSRTDRATVPRRTLSLARRRNAPIIQAPNSASSDARCACRASREAAARDGTPACPSRELLAKLLLERAVGVEPRDLVFVLDRHQLEQRVRNLVRKSRTPRRRALLSSRDPGYRVS